MKKIQSRLFQREVWLADREEEINEEPMIYPSELPFLLEKNPTQLKVIWSCKEVFPGCKIIQ